MAIARHPTIVLDCSDAAALARFWGELLGWEVTIDDGWSEIRSDNQCICFQPVADYRPPAWPGQDVPQQMHIDVVVDDLDVAEKEVVAMGAVKHEHQPGETFRVFLDPAGHPFCLCTS